VGATVVKCAVAPDLDFLFDFSSRGAFRSNGRIGETVGARARQRQEDGTETEKSGAAGVSREDVPVES
jgi:hypothetical protein